MVALVDCNNFYASCERLFQPRLAHKAVVVLSNNDGCVIARSDEAKALGIKMGAPAFLMEEMLNHCGVSVFSSNYALYGSMSNRVIQVLQAHCPVVEVYSIDEAFLHLSGLFQTNYYEYAVRVREAIKATGIPVSIGIAPSKTLAKMANRFIKKTDKEKGIHVLDTHEKMREALLLTEVEDIWGVGPEYAKLLRRNGFKTAADVCNAPGDWMRKNMTVTGQRLWNELRGIPCIEVEEVIPNKKNICVARSFGQLLSEKKDVEEALANFVAIAARKLRQQGSCCRLINVFVQTNNYRQQDKQYHRSVNVPMPVPTSSTPELLHYATWALERIWKENYNFKKVGILLLDLSPCSEAQTGLFDVRNRTKDARLMKAMDDINIFFGNRDLVKFSVQGYERKWKLKQEKLSQRYTTRLDEVLTIQI